ncbi:hypothetical protein T484DRAFT_1755503 [Baffinella frigidus]|nr:hypothetical protein T484DRAFT_1755503 [Cryptophyta sp. CCMP2293]
MAMEQITERITAEVMQELGGGYGESAWDYMTNKASKARKALSNTTSNYRTRVLSLQNQIHEHAPQLKEDIDKILAYKDIVELKKKIQALKGNTELKKTMDLVMDVLPVQVTAEDQRFAPIPD